MFGRIEVADFNAALGVADWRAWRGKELLLTPSGVTYPKGSVPADVSRDKQIRNILLQKVIDSVKEVQEADGQSALSIDLELLNSSA